MSPQPFAENDAAWHTPPHRRGTCDICDAYDALHPTPSAENAAALLWNDPLLEACEGAPCRCGHEALDHAWYGCEECGCTLSGIHVVIVSGVVEMRVIPPAEGRES